MLKKSIPFFTLLAICFTLSLPGKNVMAEDVNSSKILMMIVPVIGKKTSAPCPKDLTRFVLVPHHTWTFSPGGQTDVMEINGNTTGGSCDIWVAGDAATGEDCIINYHNSGTVQTDAGPCSHSGDSTAILSFDEGKCKKGVIIMNITEVQNPDSGLDGTLTCPSTSEPYVTFYPPSLSQVFFAQRDEGHTVAEDGTDAAGYSYEKQWVLMPASAIP